MIGSIVSDYNLYSNHTTGVKLDRVGSESFSAGVFHFIHVVYPSGASNKFLIEGEVYVNDDKIVFANPSSGLKHLIVTGSAVVFVDELSFQDAQDILKIAQENSDYCNVYVKKKNV